MDQELTPEELKELEERELYNPIHGEMGEAEDDSEKTGDKD